jgi:phage virion morphogenesis protein
MAGAFIGLESGFEIRVLAALRELQRKGKNLRPAFEDIGEHLIVSHHDRWALEESPNGKKWAGLSPFYKERKEKHADKILLLHGHLRDTLRYQASASSLSFGTDRIYGAVHQFGASKGAFGTTRRGAPIPWGDIPARPWLGLSMEDEGEILEIIADHFDLP